MRWMHASRCCVRSVAMSHFAPPPPDDPGWRFDGRNRCGTGGLVVGHTGQNAIRMSTRLRPASDRNTGRIESAVYGQQWRILRRVPGPGTAYVATFNPNGVVLKFIPGDTGTLELFGEPAEDRTPPRIADDYPQDSAGSYIRLRLLVMVAVKNGLALIAAAVGPYHQFGPDFGSVRPSGANLQLALDMGKYVNSFTWRGDPPR